MRHAPKTAADDGDDSALNSFCLDESASGPGWGQRLFERERFTGHASADWQLDLEMQLDDLDLDLEEPFDDDDFAGH